MKNVTELSEQNFEQFIKEASKPVLVDFWAAWCGPCKALAPVIEELAAEGADKLHFCKLNIEDGPEVATKFNIRSIPTLMIFNKGEVVATRAGFSTKELLKDWVMDNLKIKF